LSNTHGFPVFSQCTSCSTCSATFCDITISADNTTDYTLSGNFAEDKMCITAGTYSGDITLNGSTPTICVTGGTFAPASFTNSGGYNFYLYVNSGAAATFPGNTTFTNNWYNNGTITVNGNLTTSAGFPDNCGSLTVNGDFTITTSFDNCSGGTILVTGDLKNDGTFNINPNYALANTKQILKWL
jgi:formylmethanofuran dehydrogenase subunit C